MRLASRTVSSRLRTDCDRGTGSPAADSSVRVSSLPGDVDCYRRRLRSHSGPDPFLMNPLAELDQRRGVEPQIGYVAADRLLHDRLGRRPERGPLPAHDEILEGFVEVEIRVRDDQVVDQPDRELTGAKPYRLVVVGVDHVVASAL